MGSMIKYSALVTKIRAMRAKLLRDEDFQFLAELFSVPEIVGHLKGYPAYRDILCLLDEADLHRGNIEKVLVQSLYEDYTKLYRFSGLEQRRFLKLYLKRYEVELINYCFRIIFNHYQKPFDLDYKKRFFDRYSQISIDRLIGSKNMKDLVEGLRDTEYYGPLSNLLDAGAQTLFDFDLALNLYYFSSIWREKKKILKKKELEIFTKEAGTQVDLLNLQWIYRSKKYYEMQPADIYALLIPIHFHIHAEELKKLTEVSGTEEFKTEVTGSFYGKRYRIEDTASIEQMYRECLRRLYLTERRRDPYSIASLTAYLFYKEEEIQRLITIMERVRYGLPSEQTAGYVKGVIGV